MSIDQAISSGNFDMGRVVKSTFAAVQQHAMVLFPAALVLVGGSQAIAYAGLGGGNPTEAVLSPLYWIGLLVSMLGGILMQSLAIYTVVEGHRGRSPTLASAIAPVLKTIVPAFVAALVASLGIGFGMVLLLVPGMILGVMWCVSVPAAVVEGVGPIKALGRSRALTKGSRWPLFGLILVAFIAAYVLSMAIYGFNFAAAASVATDGMAVPQMIGAVIIGTLTSVLFGAGLAAIYTELRMVKEGVSNDQLAAAFD
jgi:hypothetical protein